MYNETKEKFPGPFTDYETHVAGRTPFSYFLELVWRVYGRDNDSDVRKQLSETRSDCRNSNGRYALIPAVIVVIHVSDKRNKRKYYGASVSCIDRCKELLTLLSCRHDWHPDVQSAVMSVFPDREDNARQIQLRPDEVSCKAYDMQNIRVEIPPCKRCNQLYCLPNHTYHLNPPGNCAETEAISNLLKSEVNVVLEKTTIPEHQDAIKEEMRSYFKTNIKPKLKEANKYNIDHVYIPEN
ncbi:uncharacterized protein LOC134309262 [Trichomycterus rosablanca]|uniref:uncharacterized protein LOC134309262 n=1 Tax=Trichomycterus rosablanca TaxID=2290929 RepID=UPI002F359C46